MAPIAIVQSFRLLMLVTSFLPSAVVLVTGGDLSVLPGQGQPAASPLGLALVLAGGLALGTVLARLGVAASILLGTAFVSTVLHVTDIAPGAVPPVIAVAGLVLIGLFIAERFRTLEWDRPAPRPGGPRLLHAQHDRCGGLRGPRLEAPPASASPTRSWRSRPADSRP